MHDSDAPGTTRRSIVKTLGIGATVGLAGCSGGGGDGGDGDGGSSGDGGDGSDGDTGTTQNTDKALMWEYGFPNEEGAEPIWKNAFTENYEDRTGQAIEIGRFSYEDMRQKFLTGARTGDPDAIEGVLSHLTEYVKAGHLESLDGWAEELEHYDGFVESALDACRYKGKLYGLPYEGNGRAFIVRKDILDELGQDMPETTQEMHEIGRMVNKEVDGVTGFHNCTKDGSVRAFQEFMSSVYQFTDNLYVPDGDSWKLNIEAEALGKILDDYYYQIYAADNPVGTPDDLGTGWQTNDPGYINGNYAFIECGTWLRGWTSGENIDSTEEAEDILDNKTRVTHIPRSEGGEKGTFLEIKPVMVNSHSDNKQKGKQAIAAWTEPDTLEGMAEDSPGKAMTPVHEDIESTIDNDDWAPFTEVFKTGRALAKIAWGPVRQEFYPLMQEVAYGRTDPYEAGDQLHTALKGLESDL
ncbi:ABC transporter substrate-binding protein [Halosimplex amylolyticum]|uniref:ABC transporter substrate-binding protein n=1 Tax=Halosimplex amylolyticum TaxID=3396616 RepID=UPI003F5708C9